MTCSTILQRKVFLWRGLSSKIASALVMMESFVCWPSVNVYNIWIFKVQIFCMINLLLSFLCILVIWCP
jgi:hypothetical protein